MKQTMTVNNYGNITFVFNKSLEDALKLIQVVSDDESYNDVVYSYDLKADNLERQNEIAEFTNYVKDIYADCSLLDAENSILKGYVLKKNGKFRKGTTAHYKYGVNTGYYDSEFTNSWHTLIVYGKALSENEIEVIIELKWLTV